MKKIVVGLIVVACILWAAVAVLVVPIPKAAYDDGGTREYVALAYKIVDWNRITPNGTYEKLRIYFGEDCRKSIDELWDTERHSFEETMIATVLEVYDGSVLLQPFDDGRNEQIVAHTADLDDIGVTAGSAVEIFYSGEMMLSYPAQIVATDWRIVNEPRYADMYEGEWIDKTTAIELAYSPFSDMRIKRIYADCFIGQTLGGGSPYFIKMNVKLSPNWCEGDTVSCTYENVYQKEEGDNYYEADMLTIEAITRESESGMMAYKPVVYLYPEEELTASVVLELNGELTCTYPAYENGWTVTASPDGTLTDETGQIYNYLYWEGETNIVPDFSSGFCVKGEDTAAFLENVLEQLGLSRREANEFIVFWLPMMEQNPYNLISFQTDRYEEAASLQVTPAPDTMIRVFMTWQKTETYVDIPAQTLIAPARDGFTVVEWGGTEIQS